ncbi:citrate lyase subunit beta [Halomonas cupida]|uniref:Citrate lyase subunit beta n=1 Tax=Halomonas cupida TaxID=44933 RepID=A0A1M7G846_9GAMM|nr:aldolase/citrate lyase family protein [Halomonas cupida]GEN23685.1 citrate lyase subunit beta [Halomonas cupida]SHM12305.1 citrate lyase subunit beta / citryl-CoA lyase [Halomonas cupida]
MSLPFKTPIKDLRSWLFIGGHDLERIESALEQGPDVLVVDLEEFTPAESRQAVCAGFAEIVARCERHHCVAAVRINRLSEGGAEELVALSRIPAVVFLPQVDSAQCIAELDPLLTERELRSGLTSGSTVLIPTLESRLGLERSDEILRASPRLEAALLGSGDLARDLGLESGNRVAGLAAWRRHLVEACRHVECLAIDGPWPEPQGFVEDQAWAQQLGFRARCVVDSRQIAPLHQALASGPGIRPRPGASPTPMNR